MRHVCLISFLMMIALSACTTKSSASYTEEEIQEIASSDDYDAMIDAMYACVDECGAVKDEYLDGNMPDKEAKSKCLQKNYDMKASAFCGKYQCKLDIL